MSTTISRAPLQWRPSRTRLVWLVTVLAAVIVLCAISIAVGSRQVPLDQIWLALGGGTEGLDQAAVSKRIPRTILAALAGAALAVAGTAMQGVTRNPLADPGILGVNTGASLAVVIGLAWFGMASQWAYIWTAIFGAGVTAVFVYTIGSMGRGGATPLKLALAGVATTVAFQSFVTGIILQETNLAEGVRSWQIGGVGGATFAGIAPALPFLAVGFLVCMVSAKRLNALALGDELAAGLGERVLFARALASAGAVVLCGATTAICGPIAFIGLVVPHFCRLLVGVDHRWLLPFSALVGAGLLIGSDVIARIIMRPAELDVGIITAFIGAPFFIWIVRRQRVREL